MKIALPELLRGVLDGRLPANVKTAWYEDTRDVAAASHDADVLVIGSIVPEEIRFAIESAQAARWISTHAAGVDHYPHALIRERGVLFTKGSGVNAVPIAESMVMFVLSAAKGFPAYLASSARGVWPVDRPPAIELTGSRALIIGYGEIGRAVGERLRAFEVNVTGVRRKPSHEPGIIGESEWKSRLGEFDWVLVTAALTPNTYHLLGMNEFRRMKPTTWVSNVSRGGLIDHEALVEALREGRPRGAYLDVTEPEPLPQGHPLWTIPNVYITGHAAGRSTRSLQRYAAMFLNNVERFQSGEPLHNLVDPMEGY